MENSYNSQNSFLIEQEYLNKLRQEQPEGFVRAEPEDHHATLARVGIVLPYRDLPLGIIKYHALDFIVEEVLNDGSVIDSSYKPAIASGNHKPFIEATLVKAGVSTFDAVKDLCRAFKISETKIAYGGVKDAKAVTSQKITLSGVDMAHLLEHRAPHYFLKDVAYSDSAFSQGKIKGNRFTILTRTEETLDQEHVKTRLDELNRNGFWNFYWTQRFGTRLLSHQWGMFVLKNKPDKIVRSYLTESGPHDAPFFQELRKQAAEKYGDWNYIYDLYKPFPFTFRYELLILEYLKGYSSDFVGALRTIPEQVKFWTYAYASYLANQMMSSFAQNPEGVPPTIPLVLTNNQKEREVYKSYLDKDGVALNFNTGRFDFIRMTPRQIETRIKPEIKNYGILLEGAVLEFDLPKGAYATTFLSHIFTLTFQKNQPWLKTNIYDLKQALGEPDITATIEKLGVLSSQDQPSETESD